MHAGMTGLVTHLHAYILISKAVFQPFLIQGQIHVLFCPKVRGNFTVGYSLETNVSY